MIYGCTYCHFFERECRHCTYSEIWQCLTVAAANSFHSALQGFLDIQNFKIVQTGTSGTRKVSIWSCHDKRPAHTHTNKDNRLLFATGTHSRNIFCWDLPKHIVVWLCDGFARVFSIEWLRGQLTTTTYRFLPCEAPGKLLMSRSWSSKMLDLDEVGLHRPFFS